MANTVVQSVTISRPGEGSQISNVTLEAVPLHNVFLDAIAYEHTRPGDILSSGRAPTGTGYLKLTPGGSSLIELVMDGTKNHIFLSMGSNDDRPQIVRWNWDFSPPPDVIYEEFSSIDHYRFAVSPDGTKMVFIEKAGVESRLKVTDTRGNFIQSKPFDSDSIAALAVTDNYVYISLSAEEEGDPIIRLDWSLENRETVYDNPTNLVHYRLAVAPDDSRMVFLDERDDHFYLNVTDMDENYLCPSMEVDSGTISEVVATASYIYISWNYPEPLIERMNWSLSGGSSVYAKPSNIAHYLLAVAPDDSKMVFNDEDATGSILRVTDGHGNPLWIHRIESADSIKAISVN